MLPGLRLRFSEKERDELMEIACILTVDETESIVIHLTDKSLDKMQEWCIKQHGLVGRVRSAAPRSRGWCWICWP